MPGDEQGASIPHGVLGGMVTDITPPLTVEGLSPDCQDIVFLPQQVKQREALKKIFAVAFFADPVYEKTYIPPNEEEVNLFIDALGKMYLEDPLTAPGVYNHISNLPITGITAAQSVTAFGREYIACSDGAHGVHIPLQFDNEHIDRVSQDGPGVGPQINDVDVGFAIAAAPTGLIHVGGGPIASASQVGTLVTALGVGILPFFGLIGKVVAGDQILVAGFGTAGYNGTFTLVSIDASQITYNAGVSGLAPDGGGGSFDTTVSFVSLDSVATDTGFFAGETVVIAGAGVGGYDGSWTIRSFPTIGVNSQFYIAVATFGLADSGGGTVGVGGIIDPGVHNAVVMFLTRQGYITKPSPAGSWTAAGSKGAEVSGIPIGPSNVVARIIAFTGAGGGNYFYIPVSLLLPGTTTSIRSTVINDNTSTSLLVNFSDNTLFGSTSIDVAGRNYFAQVVLGECLGVFAYASRMLWWGERNKVQSFLNMGFEGGHIFGDFINPPGWMVDSPGTGGGLLVNGGAWVSGVAWQITDDGSASPRGKITQVAYKNSLGTPILQPNTAYSPRIWAQKSIAGAAGSITFELSSADTGFSATAIIPLSQVTTLGGFVEADFSSELPSVIPSDLVFSLWTSGSANGTIVLLDEVNIIPTLTPYRDALFRASYINAPEQFDGVTGVLGSTSDFTPIRNCFQIRNTMYYHTQIGKSSTTDNGTGEPSTWLVPEVSESVGSLSVHGSDAGRIGIGESAEQWQFTISEQGVYVFAGGDDMKISQEIQKPTANGFPGWDSINAQAIGSSWVKNDMINRRLYIGVPTGTATAPNVVFVLDYHNLNSAWEIYNNPPYRSFGNRLLAQELARKWTRWSLSLNTAEEISRGSDAYAMTFGSGNGETPGTAPGFNNVYTLDAAKLTDDDYGQIVPYRFTHFFPTPDSRQQYRLGTHRIIATYLALFIGGTGFTSITPVVNTLSNTFPELAPYPLNPDPTFDYEWDVWLQGERIALKIGSVPADGQTDNGFVLQDLSLTVKKDPWSPIRGTMLA